MKRWLPSPWLSLGLLPLLALAAAWGGWWWVLLPAYAWFLTTALDGVLGLDPTNADPLTGAEALFWHRAVTVVWFPLQFAAILAILIVHDTGNQHDNHYQFKQLAQDR